MTEDAKIQKLDDFKAKLQQWDASYRDAARRAQLRTYLNQNKAWVRQEVIEAGCFHTVTIGPPPTIGGLIMRDIDPFSMLFEKPYLKSMIPLVTDMIDQTIGALRAGPREPKAPAKSAQVEYEMRKNYAFVAMPIDSSKPELEDVLDAIKEGAARCGVQAERVDSVESNERITDRILESIRKTEFVIVDLTFSRPNVFFEAGYSHGIGKTPIYVAREGTPLEFDLKDYPAIFFRNMKQLKDGIEKRLRALAESQAAT